MQNPKIIVYVATSLDGFIARKDGSVDWLYTDDDYGYSTFYKTVNQIIIGRKTYEQILTFGDWPYDKETFILSHKKLEDDKITWEQNIDELLPKLKGNVWLVGGSKTISSFLRKNLVDEFIITVHPFNINEGIPLIQNAEVTLEKIDEIELKNKLVQITYKVKK